MLRVVKVGGSLYDLPDLGRRLRAVLEELGPGGRLVVPGGGPTAAVVRAFDRDHGLGDEAAHWLALRACSLNAHLLLRLLPGARLVRHPAECRGVAILDALAFVQGDDGRPGALPHHWGATSDSVAARAAAVAGAELVLLKSVTLPGPLDCDEAAARGHIDPVLPGIARAAGLRVRAINLRAWSPGTC
jgi:aspartokinase-like uncharacterized kinase